MKQTISVLISAFLIVILTFAISVIGFADSLHGDVNADGKISVVDAKWILQSVAGARELDANASKLADVNRDGKISVVDAKWVLQSVAGMREISQTETTQDVIEPTTEQPTEPTTEPTTEPYVKADTSELERYIEIANSLNKSEHTEETFSALEQAVENAQAIVDAEKADDNEVAIALDELKSALDNLKTYQNCLEDTVMLAYSINLNENCSEELSERMLNSIDYAFSILYCEDITPEQFQSANDEIINLIAEVKEYKLNSLNSKINDAEGIDITATIDGSHYSAQRIENLNNAVAHAKEIANSNADFDDIDKEIKALNIALKGLKTYKELLRDNILKARTVYSEENLSGSPDLKSVINSVTNNVYLNSSSTDEDYINAMDTLSQAVKEFDAYYLAHTSEGVINWK